MTTVNEGDNLYPDVRQLSRKNQVAQAYFFYRLISTQERRVLTSSGKEHNMLVLPVYNKLVMPYADIYFQTEEFKKLSGNNVAMGEKVIIIVSKEDQERDEMTEDSFYPIGISGVVSEISSEGYIAVKTLNRVNLDTVYVNADHTIDLTLSKRADIQDLDETVSYQKLLDMKKEVMEFSGQFKWGDYLNSYVEKISTAGSLAAVLSPWLTLDNEERYAVLAEDSMAKRMSRIEEIVYGYIEVARVQTDAAEGQQKEYRDAYREQAIHRQMDALQHELDRMHPEKVSDVAKLDEKINNSGMNETALAEARKVLARLKSEGRESQESGMLYDYLDFLTGLSWKKEKAGFTALDQAQKVLDEDHYGLKKVKRRILQQIAVMNLKKQQSGSILLFVGAPGTGKTSIGKSIAGALGREYVRVSLGGVRDEADIRGHRRTYIGAMPGRIIDGISKSGVSNPVMVLDEVDKLSASYSGDPASALLEVLDPEQNSTFTDHYMNVPYDLSDVFFICTANTTETIPAPLLNRMEVIDFTGYTPSEKLLIAKEHLIPKAVEKMGIPADMLKIPDETIKAVISDYTREAGVRGLRKRIDTLCRNAAVSISSDGKKAITIRPDMIRSELDMHPLHHEKILEKSRPGVVTGLAWTEVGGEILYIETLFTKGNGQIRITGQLGDVMKESAQIAVSLVKSMFPEKAKMFKDNDLHIHVPEGAVPKDGPSAGVTLTTAIASLVTGRAVSSETAMTGEVSLRGAVTPIGGLPEKLMAAQRAGVKKVFIPMDNTDDLEDVAKEVRDSLEIIPIREITDILMETGVIEKSMSEQNYSA